MLTVHIIGVHHRWTARAHNLHCLIHRCACANLRKMFSMATCISIESWSQAKRRKGVQWPDEAAQQSGQQLEKVIGYSDGGSFASRIGPQAVDSSSAGGGRFADLVQSRVIAARETEGQQQEERLGGPDAEGKGIVRDIAASTALVAS